MKQKRKCPKRALHDIIKPKQSWRKRLFSRENTQAEGWESLRFSLEWGNRSDLIYHLEPTMQVTPISDNIDYIDEYELRKEIIENYWKYHRKKVQPLDDAKTIQRPNWVAEVFLDDQLVRQITYCSKVSPLLEHSDYLEPFEATSPVKQTGWHVVVTPLSDDLSNDDEAKLESRLSCYRRGGFPVIGQPLNEGKRLVRPLWVTELVSNDLLSPEMEAQHSYYSIPMNTAEK